MHSPATSILDCQNEWFVIFWGFGPRAVSFFAHRKRRKGSKLSFLWKEPKTTSLSPAPSVGRQWCDGPNSILIFYFLECVNRLIRRLTIRQSNAPPASSSSGGQRWGDVYDPPGSGRGRGQGRGRGYEGGRGQNGRGRGGSGSESGPSQREEGGRGRGRGGASGSEVVGLVDEQGDGEGGRGKKQKKMEKTKVGARAASEIERKPTTWDWRGEKGGIELMRLWNGGEILCICHSVLYELVVSVLGDHTVGTTQMSLRFDLTFGDVNKNLKAIEKIFDKARWFFIWDGIFTYKKL